MTGAIVGIEGEGNQVGTGFASNRGSGLRCNAIHGGYRETFVITECPGGTGSHPDGGAGNVVIDKLALRRHRDSVAHKQGHIKEIHARLDSRCSSFDVLDDDLSIVSGLQGGLEVAGEFRSVGIRLSIEFGVFVPVDGFDKVEEFEIGPEEYLNKFHVRIDTEVTQVGFETNKGKSIVVGGTKGEDKYVKLNEGNNIIISLYGNYNKYLEAIGVGFVNRDWYMKKLCFGYFELRFKLKKDDNFKKEWTDKINFLDTYQKAMIKACSLPDSAFTEIIKFCI